MKNLFLLLALIALSACGDESKKRVVVRPKNPAPIATPPPGNGGEGTVDLQQAAWDEVRPLVQQNCATAGCHDGRAQQAFNTARWFSSAALGRISNGSMPPNRALAPNVREALLDSFDL